MPSLTFWIPSATTFSLPANLVDHPELPEPRTGLYRLDRHLVLRPTTATKYFP